MTDTIDDVREELERAFSAFRDLRAWHSLSERERNQVVRLEALWRSHNSLTPGQAQWVLATFHVTPTRGSTP